MKPLLWILVAVMGLGGGYWWLQQSESTKQDQVSTGKIDVQPTASLSTINVACTGELTPVQNEGPYYLEGSPEHDEISQGVEGEPLEVTGTVYDQTCTPVAGAWLDFWQADAAGEYDLEGYRLRGHQYTDNNGRYRLKTVMPATYGTRPPHIHVKVRLPEGDELTSQMYFAGTELNQLETIFDPALVMTTEIRDGLVSGTFDFVVKR